MQGCRWCKLQELPAVQAVQNLLVSHGLGMKMVNKGLQMFMDFKARSNPAVHTVCNVCFLPIIALLKEAKLLLKFTLFDSF